MQLLVCVCFAWVTILLFAITPKRLSILDFVFLYCIVLSLTSTSFTILELNFHVLNIPSGSNLLAATVFRVITVPLLILMFMNAIHRKPQWLVSFSIWIALISHDWALHRFKVINYHLLNIWVFLGLAYMGLIIIVWVLMLWYKKMDHKKVGQI
jgi:hypothetical protein